MKNLLFGRGKIGLKFYFQKISDLFVAKIYRHLTLLEAVFGKAKINKFLPLLFVSAVVVRLLLCDCCCESAFLVVGC